LRDLEKVETEGVSLSAGNWVASSPASVHCTMRRREM